MGSASGPWTTVTIVNVPLMPTGTGTGPTKGTFYTYLDTTAAKKSTYFYRVIANNIVGDTTVYSAPAVGYPHLSADSVPSNMITVLT